MREGNKVYIDSKAEDIIKNVTHVVDLSCCFMYSAVQSKGYLMSTYCTLPALHEQFVGIKNNTQAACSVLRRNTHFGSILASNRPSIIHTCGIF